MPKQKAKKREGTLAVEALYNALMGEIEQDLTTEMIPQLAEIYAGETPKQAKARAAHYKWAFQTFGKLWDKFVAECKAQMEELKQRALATAKREAAKEEEATLRTLEEEIQTS